MRTADLFSDMKAAGCTLDQIEAVLKAQEARADALREHKILKARTSNRDRQARFREARNASNGVTSVNNAHNGVTETPLPSRACSSLEEVSKLSLEADASKGGEPPSKDVTPDQALFRRAKEVFGKSCGGQITKLKRHCGGDVGDTRAIVEQAALAESPGEYLAAVLARSSARASFSRDGPSRFREQQLSFAERMENFVNRGSENDQNDSGCPSIIDGNVLVLPGRR